MRPDPPRADLNHGVELARLLRAAGYDAHHIQERLATADQILAKAAPGIATQAPRR